LNGLTRLALGIAMRDDRRAIPGAIRTTALRGTERLNH